MSDTKPLLIEIGTEVKAGALTQCGEAHCVRRLRVRQDAERGQRSMEGFQR